MWNYPSLFIKTITAVVSVTWSATDKSGGISLTNGNLTATSTTSGALTARATRSASNKIYYEVVFDATSTIDTNTGHGAGVANAAHTLSVSLAASNTSTIAICANGQVRSNGTNKGAAFGQLVIGDVVGIAVDIPAGRFYVRLNGGAWANGANPVAGTGGYTFTPSGTIYPACGVTSSAFHRIIHGRFSSSSWGTAAPTGYVEV